MAITTLNLRALNRSDTATSGQGITATSATAADFQDAAGGAWNLLKTVTASGASDATFVHGTGGVDLTTYKLYKFVGIDIDSSGDDVNFMIQWSDDTGSSYETSNYDTMMNYTNSTGSASTSQATDSAMYINNVGNAAGETGSFEFTFPNPSGSLNKVSWWHGCTQYAAGDVRTHEGGGIWKSTADVDAFKFKMSSGTFCGTLKLYGIS